MKADDLSTRLAHLQLARRSARDYYGAFLDDPDDILKVGAWCVLLERHELHSSQYEELVSLSAYAAIRARAFVFLQSRWEHGLAERVAKTEPRAASEEQAERMLARARLGGAPQQFADAKHADYLATGRDSCLHAILQSVSQGLPAEAALPYAFRAALIRPHDARVVEALLTMLRRVGKLRLLKDSLEMLERGDLHPLIRSRFRQATR